MTDTPTEPPQIDPLDGLCEIRTWRNARGVTIEEQIPAEAGAPHRYVAFAMCAVQALEGGPQIPIHFRFLIEAGHIADAFKAYPGLYDGEAQKAYERWLAEQGAGGGIITPGARKPPLRADFRPGFRPGRG